MDDKNTKYYIFGLLSGLLFIPLIDELSNVIAAWIQVLILLPSKLVTKGNKELAEIAGEEIEEKSPCIGFQISSEPEEYFENED